LQRCFQMPHFGLSGATGDLPHSEAAANETLALPVYPELTEVQQRRVVDVIGGFVARHAGRDGAMVSSRRSAAATTG
ncbi:MAG: DegT/DnrJ/EryC1/StrS family aminotransferase, partial [Planctomycetota bacterium]